MRVIDALRASHRERTSLRIAGQHLIDGLRMDRLRMSHRAHLREVMHLRRQLWKVFAYGDTISACPNLLEGTAYLLRSLQLHIQHVDVACPTAHVEQDASFSFTA